MKLDNHGIRFNIWLYFFLFGTAMVLLLGTLQFALITPYYRTTTTRTVHQVADSIKENLLTRKSTNEDISRSLQLAVDNNVCAVIYNDAGSIIYDADALGSGCVFHGPDIEADNTDIDLSDGLQLKQLLNDNDGEYSLNVTNPRTDQQMIIYGTRISAKLANYYLYVNSPLEPVDSIVHFFSQQYLLYALIVTIIASIVSLIISSSISKPIRLMNKEADKLARADYNTDFDGGRFTETRELASTLNDASEKLGKIDEMRKDLIANVSHDIKTPLTSIRAYAEMIRDISGNNPKKREEHLSVIINEADYMNKLVTDMSELSRMQSGNYVLKTDNFDIAECIRDVVGLSGVQIQESKVSVHLEVPQSLVVFGDELKIQQVIYNFFTNALKHTPQGKNIWIRARRLEDEETVRVEVQDEGEGIAEKDLPYIWDRYQKSSRSFSRSMTNTGLGLAIVKAILDAHKAQYGVKSKPGEGSTFWFELRQPQEPEELEHENGLPSGH
ncbi:MAG: HAMP domain-containing sensor histidine kinase [Bulleidia sp.]|nr:HAMP domain-containing sensor histidine kinase [Bulleidia sp.]